MSLQPAADDPERPSVLARLSTNEAAARRIADAIAESFDPIDAVTAAFEDGPGWTVAVHFRDPPNETAIRALIALVAGAEAANGFTFETVVPKDWVKASLEGLAPVTAGRFVVHGAHDRSRVPVNRIGIEIEAALAFGTGHHGTTRGCLLAFDRLAKATGPRRVLDVGTGTGVLAIAAARALRRRVTASDIDPRAVATARENTRLNRTGGSIALTCGAGVGRRALRLAGPFDIVFANILLGPLVRLSSPIARLAAPGGRVILSGLLHAQAPAALAAYRRQGLVIERRIFIDEWATLVLRKGRMAAPRRARLPGSRPKG
jgi:ribosomal protein L11 methyltransferase